MAKRTSKIARRWPLIIGPVLAAILFWVIAVPARGGGDPGPKCSGPGGQYYDPATQKCCGSVAVSLDQSCCSVSS